MNNSLIYPEFEKRQKFESLVQSTFTSITKAGWLQKLTSNLIKTWEKKYCILKGKVFLYYDKKNSRQPSGTFNFDQIQVKITEQKENAFTISPIGCRKSFTFKSDCEEEMQDWVSLLVRESSTSLAEIYQITSLSLCQKFWSFPQISVFEFINECKTGDILLFRSKSILSKAQRVLSRSSYDHVALLINHVGYIGFLEATRITGVNYLLWTEFCSHNWHLLYSRLIYRKLKVPNHEAFDETIKNFVADTQGSKFNVSVLKLLTKPETNAQEGFFCSELVALAFKSAGILPSDVNCSEYWPGNFADERPLFLINSSLGPLTQINFEI